MYSAIFFPIKVLWEIFDSKSYWDNKIMVLTIENLGLIIHVARDLPIYNRTSPKATFVYFLDFYEVNVLAKHCFVDSFNYCIYMVKMFFFFISPM